MSEPCRVCLRDTPADPPYHPACLKELFGAAKLPVIDIDLAKLTTVALAMVGHTSLSGVQKKISIGLSVDRGHLQVEVEGGRYILKPQTGTHVALPENEHVTMRLAKLAGLDTPPNGLFPLKDGSLAYLVRRFDRLGDNRKLLQEDFCQLAGKSPKEKYDASYEQCGRLLQRYASEPLVDARNLFRQVAFSYWVGNGDLHLKNLALLRGEDGLYRLSPAYDLLATILAIPDDQLALTIQGSRKNITRKRWQKLAEACQLPEKAASRVLREIAVALPEALDLVDRSLLPPDQKSTFSGLLRKRAAELAKASPGE